MSIPDVLIVGAGIIGASCARALAQRGVSVHVVDAGDHDGIATTAAAGMLAPMAESQPEDPLLAFSIRARDYYSELVPELEAETGIDIGLWREGVYQAAFTDEDVERAKQQVAWQRQSGFSAEWLSATELREHVPGIGPDALGATLAPEDGALEPMALLTALKQSATAHGATITLNTRVDGIRIDEERAVSVTVGEESFDAGAVLIAAGCWSGRLKGLPRPLSVEPLRGQMVALEWPRDEPRAVVYGSGGYVLKRGDEAIAGSTVEHAGYDASVTKEGINQIIRAATQIYPALTRSNQRRSWAGLRPGTPDGRPLLGKDPDVANLWYATGHGRNGILLAGLSADVLCRLYTGEEIEYDPSPVDPARFWTN
jgi:glycine oxidase